jgi:CMP-N,N'-diacetyllegionaminic acid synthase
MKALVIIPARGGSKGVPGKNIKKLNKIPLIVYTINAARKVFDDRCIIVSTDDEKIKMVVEETGLKVPFIRPAHLATDNASGYDVISHALESKINEGFEPEIIVVLQPTSPFRTAEHIKQALDIYKSSTNIDMVVSVKETSSNPYYVLFEENQNGFLEKSKAGNFVTRQDCPKVWEYNGAIYIINAKSYKGDFSSFKYIRKYEMDDASSLDIDTEMDWNIAEYLISKGK